MIPVLRGGEDLEIISQALKEVKIEQAAIRFYDQFVPEQERADYPTIIVVPSVELVHLVVEVFEDKYAGALKHPVVVEVLNLVFEGKYSVSSTALSMS